MVPHPKTQERGLNLAAGLLLLVFPCALYLLNPSWVFNNNFRFSAIYTGYFLHWPEYLQMYPGGYQSSRVPWLAPGWLAFHLLPPLGAHLALRVLLIFGTGLPVWLTLRRLGAGVSGSTIGVLLLWANPFFLQAAGWDYVNGAGLVCIACSLWFLTAAAQSPRRSAWLFAAGAAMIASLWTYLMVAFFAPVYAWFYLRQRGWPNAREATRELACLILGGVVCTGLLGMINVAMGGRFLFFMGQFAVAGSKVAATNDAYQSPALWLPGAVWLIFFGLSCVAGLVLAVPSVRRNWSLPRGVDAAGVAMLLAFLSLALLDLTATWGALEYTCGIHASYLLPFAALPIGLLIDRHLQPLPSSRQQALMFIAAGLLLLAYWPSLANWLDHRAMFVQCVFACTIIVAAFLTAAAWRPTLPGLLIILLGLSWLNPRTATGTTWWFTHSPNPRDLHLLAFDLLSKINAEDTDGRLMLWYGRDLKRPNDFALAEYATVMKNSGRQIDQILMSFPEFKNTAPLHTAPTMTRLLPFLHPGSRALLLGDSSRLPEARAALAKYHLDVSVLRQETVAHGDASIPVTLLEIERKPS